MLKRTPILALIITAIMSILIILIFEQDDRPFTLWQSLLLYFVAFFPSMGIAMLFDPYPALVKKRYSKINFYIEDENPEDQVAKVMQEEKR
jgi:amino acid transporter